VVGASLADDGALDPLLAKALQRTNAALFVVMWATCAAAVLVLRTGALPCAIGWSGAPLAPALLVASATVWVTEAGFAAWMLTLLWLIATSAAAALRRGRLPVAQSPAGWRAV
jgi:hypothetical protein